MKVAKPKAVWTDRAEHFGTWSHRIVRHVCKRWQHDANDGVNFEIVEWYDKGKTTPHLHGSVNLTGSIPDLQETVERLQRAVLRVQGEPGMVMECLCDAGKRGKK